MRDDTRNTSPRTESEQDHQALKFFFTPRDEPKPDEANPHVKPTTNVPEVVDALRQEFDDVIGEVKTYAGEDTVYVDRERLLDVMRFLKENQQFTYFVDCGAIDLFQDEKRFEVFYNLVSIAKGKRIRVKVSVEEDNPVVPSVTPLFRAANWNEREAYDMMGIRFEGHPDHRRMYMPEDFEYFPQRKEFPQLGVPGSLPLPPQVPGGAIHPDPYPAAHGSRPPRSYQEPAQNASEESASEA